VHFAFEDGCLALNFDNFSGKVVLRKNSTPKPSKWDELHENHSTQATQSSTTAIKEENATEQGDEDSLFLAQSSSSKTPSKSPREKRPASPRISPPSTADDKATATKRMRLSQKEGPPAREGVPCPRWGHTATLIENKNKMVVFGGDSDTSSDSADTLGDVHIYDIKENSWSKPINCESNPRVWHTTTYLEEKNVLLVFGGERNVTGQAEPIADIMVRVDVLCTFRCRLDSPH
jgi:hypothetical protein